MLSPIHVKVKETCTASISLIFAKSDIVLLVAITYPFVTIRINRKPIKNKIIATLANISDRTIENQYAQLATKFDVSNGKVGVTAFCYRWGVNKYAQL